MYYDFVIDRLSNLSEKEDFTITVTAWEKAQRQFSG